MSWDSCINSYPSGACPSPAGLPRRTLYLCAEERRYGSLANNGVSGNDSCGRGWQLGRGGQTAAYLGAQLAAEKIPVNFLLFTESADSALLSVVLMATRSNGRCIPPGRS